MRRIVLALMTTLTAVVLMFGYRTSTAHPAAVTTVATGPALTGDATGTGSTTPPAPVPTTSSGTATGSGATPSATTPSAATPSAATATYAGDAAQTRWGPVQVQITVADGKITAVDLLQVPSENPRDVEINDQAVPVLEDETIQAQSAQIDAVSGATVTSDGYTSSLQSALDQAGL